MDEYINAFIFTGLKLFCQEQGLTTQNRDAGRLKISSCLTYYTPIYAKINKKQTNTLVKPKQKHRKRFTANFSVRIWDTYDYAIYVAL